jgi:hypothetical protein
MRNNYKNFKNKGKNNNITRYSVTEINSKLKKTMFISNITTISLNNRKNYKISTKTEPWKQKLTNKKSGNNKKKDNTKLSRCGWPGKMKKS